MHPFSSPFINRLVRGLVNSRPFRVINPRWYRRAVGGRWEEMGRLQFDFLLEQGLRSEDFLLDVGCGGLRGGIHFIRYLDPGHYFGIDVNKALLRAGRGELKRHDLIHKKPILVQMGDFNFASLNQHFDFALAQSVFTHLPLNGIMRCIRNIERVLVRGGRFYVTFFENQEGPANLQPIVRQKVDGSTLLTYFDQDPYHYTFATFEWICERTSLKVEYIGDWNHPAGQKMMVFTKKKSAEA